MGTIAQIFESGEHSSKKGLFNSLVMLARVDGKVDDSESQLLERIAQKLSLTPEQVIEIIDHPNEYPMIPPVTRTERCERFVELVKMISVDGVIEKSEEQLVGKYGIALGFTNEEVNRIEPLVIEMVIANSSDEEIIKSIL